MLALHMLDQRHRVAELHAALGTPLEATGFNDHAGGAALQVSRVSNVSMACSSQRQRHQYCKAPTAPT